MTVRQEGGPDVQIVVYRIAGQQGWLTVPDWVCRECDLTVRVVLQACRKAGVPEESVEVRPWLVKLKEAWSLGAQHPPAVVVNGQLYSQEKVPNMDELAAHLARVRTGEAEGLWRS